MSKKIFRTFLISMTLVVVSACSTTRLGVDITSSTIKAGIGAFYEEGDFELARHGLESNIKLLEVFYKADPSNKNIRILLSQAYAGYTFIFLETDLLYANNKNDADKITARINDFYNRGLKYGLSVLTDEDTMFKKDVEKNDLELFATSASTLAEQEAFFCAVFNW